MASAVYVCLFALIVTAYAQMMDTPMVCPMNERYVRCMHEVCHKTCLDIHTPPPCAMLTTTCWDPGCVCQIGFLRNAQGMCVNLYDCDCPPNEKYYKCSPEVCYQTCQHLKTPPPCPSLSSDCFVPACVCNEGLLRNDDGVCIPEQDCS